MAKITSSSPGDRQLETGSGAGVSPHNDLIGSILQDPLGFVFNPLPVSSEFSDLSVDEALKFFSAPEISRYVYSVSSAYFHNRFPKVNAQLFSMGMSQFPQSRFWPFWKADKNNLADPKDQDQVEACLLHLWNQPPSGYPSMYHQTGRVEIEDTAALGDQVFFFKCGLPIYRHGGKKPSTLTIAFDTPTRGFYSINARIRYEDPEFRFRYLEFINPNLVPPRVQSFLEEPRPRQWKVLLVLDRHIGDNLSLFSTHIKYLANTENFDLTLDTSLCPLFNNAPRAVIDRFLPAMPVNVSGSLPAYRGDYDLVFDPYDWTGGVFALKPQNDSTAISIVSGLELVQTYRKKKRRDILEIHTSALKRFGIVPPDMPVPEFVRYRLTPTERASVRRMGRLRAFGRAALNDSVKIVVLFPLGLTSERSFATDPLQILIQNLLRDPKVYIVLAGAERDTEELMQSVRSDWPGVAQPCQHRLKVYVSEQLPELVALMLASDALVCMDSGPLHIARSLRVNPIALYTKKINDPDFVAGFPWLVEDNTAEILKPHGDEDHVRPDMIAEFIKRRLRS